LKQLYFVFFVNDHFFASHSVSFSRFLQVADNSSQQGAKEKQASK
jgi:hypothetical protein